MHCQKNPREENNLLILNDVSLFSLLKPLLVLKRNKTEAGCWHFDNGNQSGPRSWHVVKYLLIVGTFSLNPCLWVYTCLQKTEKKCVYSSLFGGQVGGWKLLLDAGCLDFPAGSCHTFTSLLCNMTHTYRQTHKSRQTHTHTQPYTLTRMHKHTPLLLWGVDLKADYFYVLALFSIIRQRSELVFSSNVGGKLKRDKNEKKKKTVESLIIIYRFKNCNHLRILPVCLYLIICVSWGCRSC